jgi:hypothetical protein
VAFTPFFATATVEAESNFAAYGQAIELRVNKACVEAVQLMLSEVRAAETRVGRETRSGRLPGVHVPEGVHLRDSFRAQVVPTFGFGIGPRSQLLVVYSPNPNAIWQELGTRGRRRKASQHGAGETEGNRGVKPLYFMRKGLRRAFPQVRELLEKAVTEVDVAAPHFSASSTSAPVFPRSQR